MNSQNVAEDWVPKNMRNSHIGEFIKYLQKIIILDKDTYFPLIQDFLIFCSADLTKSEHKDIARAFQKVFERNSKLKIDLEGIIASNKNRTVVLEQIRSSENKEEINKEIEKVKKIIEIDEGKIKVADEEIEKVKEEIKEDKNYYELLKIVLAYKDKDYLLDIRKKAIILRLFNHLTISILKAEYSLFDNYSDVLKEISGFERTIDLDKNFKIKAILRSTIERQGKAGFEEFFYSEFSDSYLIKSIITSIWYCIEICKSIDHKLSPTKINANFQIINSKRKERIDTIYQIFTDNTFLDNEVVDLFEGSIKAIFNLTRIDYYYEFNKENFDDLFSVYEILNSLKRIFDFDRNGLDIKDEEIRKYCYQNELLGKTSLLLEELNVILGIVEIKSKILIQQMIKHYDSEEGKDKFDKQYDFIFYGSNNIDEGNNLKSYLSNIDEYESIKFVKGEIKKDKISKYPTDEYAKSLNHLPKGNYLNYLLKDRSDSENEFPLIDETFDLFTEYSRIEGDKCNGCGNGKRRKSECKNHCSNGENNTKQDIIDFNEASRASIETYRNFKPIIKRIRNYDDEGLFNTDIKEILTIDDYSQTKIKKLLDDIIKSINSEYYKDNSEFNKKFIDINPTVLQYYIEFFHKITNAFLSEIREVADDNMILKSERIMGFYYEQYKEIINRFNDYCNDKSSRSIGEFRFFPPFQECFYEINDSVINCIKRTKEDFIDEISNDENIVMYKNNIETEKDIFFFLSYGLHPVNVDLLKKKNQKYQEDFIIDTNKKDSLVYKKQELEHQKLKKLQNSVEAQERKYELQIEKQEKDLRELRNQLITVLGILGSFIAFVSFATGTLKAVDTVAEFVIFAVVFCAAIGVLGWFIRGVKFSAITKFSKMQKKVFWAIFCFISALIVFFIVWFCINDFKERNTGRIIIQQEVYTKTA